MTKEIDLHEDMASHDVAIKKYKNYKSSSKLGTYYLYTYVDIFQIFYILFSNFFKLKLDLLNEIHVQISDPTWSPADKTWIFGEKPEKKQKTQKTSRPRGPRGLASSLIMRPAIDRPCTPKCPGM